MTIFGAGQPLASLGAELQRPLTWALRLSLQSVTAKQATGLDRQRGVEGVDGLLRHFCKSGLFSSAMLTTPTGVMLYLPLSLSLSLSLVQQLACALLARC